jgi:hypothetical protein
MVQTDDIMKFIQEHSSALPSSPDTDLFEDMRIVGDDFHELIERYAEKYQVDLSGYLWYFHADEEGINYGGIFFKPPYARVERIPVTSRMLTRFAEKRKWELNYPEHTIPKRRFDLMINQIITAITLLGFVVWGVWKLVE